MVVAPLSRVFFDAIEKACGSTAKPEHDIKEELALGDIKFICQQEGIDFEQTCDLIALVNKTNEQAVQDYLNGGVLNMVSSTEKQQE